MSGGPPEINFLPENALGEVVKPILMSDGNIAMHAESLIQALMSGRSAANMMTLTRTTNP